MEGVRHTSLVQTDSALNTIDLASEVVHEWELWMLRILAKIFLRFMPYSSCQFKKRRKVVLTRFMCAMQSQSWSLYIMHCKFKYEWSI